MLDQAEKISEAGALPIPGDQLTPGERKRAEKLERRLIEEVSGQKIHMPRDLRMDLMIWSKQRRLSISRIAVSILRRHVPEFDIKRRRFTGLSEPE